MISELQREAAFTAGKHAAAVGRPLSSCPFNPDDGQEEQLLALSWLRGYRPDDNGDGEDSDGGADSGEGGDQTAALDDAARARFNKLHPRGFGGKFGDKAGDPLSGLEALQSVPARLTPGKGAHGGKYAGETLDGPAGMGKVRALSQYEGIEYQKVNDFLRGRWRGQPGPGKLPPKEDVGEGRFTARGALTESHSDDPDDLSTVDIVDEIDKTMKVSKLQQDVVAERTIRRGEQAFGRDVWYGDIVDWDSSDFDEQDRQLEVWKSGVRPDLTGMRFKDHGYSSTTVDPVITKAYADRYVRVNSPIDGEPVVFRILVPAGTGAVALSPLEKGSEAEILLERGLTFEVVQDHGVDDGGVRRLDVRVVRDE